TIVAASTSRTVARVSKLSTERFRSPRSMELTYVRWSPERWARLSCDNPFFLRADRTRLPTSCNRRCSSTTYPESSGEPLESTDYKYHFGKIHNAREGRHDYLSGKP